MKVFTSKNQKLGELGERVAALFLKDRGFEVVERNYTKKIGEIDIVATKGGILHFVEVKSLHGDVSGDVPGSSPFQNITPFKLRKISRTIQWYLAERGIGVHEPWVIDAISVTVTRETRHAKVDVLWNVVA